MARILAATAGLTSTWSMRIPASLAAIEAALLRAGADLAWHDAGRERKLSIHQAPN